MSASVEGTSHAARRLPCQDAHRVLALGNGTLIAAVADGAGTAARAEQGSTRIVEACSRYLADRLNVSLPETAEECTSLLTGSIVDARRQLEDAASALDVQLRELASTMLVAIVTPRWLSIAQVGDGSIVYRDCQNGLHVLSPPANAEFVNETTFLTSAHYLDALHCRTLPGEGVSGLALMSDGVQFLALRYADNTAFAPFFTPLFEFLDESVDEDPSQPAVPRLELEALLRSQGVCDRTDDDKTLVLAVCNNACRIL